MTPRRDERAGGPQRSGGAVAPGGSATAPAALPFPFPTVGYRDGAVVLIDQTRLPGELRYRPCRTVSELCAAIRELAVRGAPALGIAAAFGLVIAADRAVAAGDEPVAALTRLEAAARELTASRPTAVNLTWALARQLAAARACVAGASVGQPPADQRAATRRLRERLLASAEHILAEDIATGRAIGSHGAGLLPDSATILTHCNAGGLATGGYGTALGIVYAAAELGKRVRVYADETRPLLQGARLTAWELAARGIDVTLLCDGAAGSLLRGGRVDAVIVGADRIARNGDTANKIGTYPLAVLAREHTVPFYVAAPISTFDPMSADGAAIAIEERAAEEVLVFRGVPTSPAGTGVYNPAFDVTPAALITAFVTERGIVYPPDVAFLSGLGGTDPA